MSGNWETINVDFSDGVIDVELNRPARLNAINLQMATELLEATRPLARRDDAKVMVLRGAGQAFCAGADVGAVTEAVDEAGSVTAQINEHAQMAELLTTIEKLPVAKVAQVHGHCVGAGLLLASMCELKVAGHDATFSVPELAFGIPFSMGALPRLVRYLGLTLSAEMVLTGRRLPADEAKAAGFLTDVVPQRDLALTVARLVEQVKTHPKYLVMETVERLREAGDALVEARRSDLTALVLATRDTPSRQAMEEYARRVLAKKM